MNGKPEKNPPRNTRQQARNSPNSKLLNAAWPKAPSNPTRKSHIKTVDHGPFERSWNEWRQKKSECFVEDMEVDNIDSNDHSSRTSNTSQKEKSTPSKPIFSSSSPSKISESPKAKVPAEMRRKDGRPVLRARRCHSEEVETKTEKIAPLEEPRKSIDHQKRKSHSVKSLFIIIHVNQVHLGATKGPATSPVKVYADKFIVQMEDETSKKEIGFRVPCKDILSLDVRFEEKPFILSFTTKTIHYNCGGPSHKTKMKNPEPVAIKLMLGYDENVPTDVKEDLQELFEVRLAEQNLWPKDNKSLLQATSSTVAQSVSATTKPRPTSELDKEEKVDATDDEKNHVIDEETPLNESPVKQPDLTRGIEQTPTKKIPLVRKRTPPINTTSSSCSSSSSAKYKVTRRTNFEQSDSMEKRIETLEHEAAHYQMVTAQQRMIIQSLESNARSTAEQAEKNSEVLKRENDMLNEEYSNKQVEISTVLNNLKIEKDLVRALESQLQACREEIELKNSLISEKSDALRVREETILELRTRIRTLSTVQAQEIKRNSEATTSKAQYDELQQRLLEVQNQRERFEHDLELKTSELENDRTEIQSLRTQVDSTRSELQTKTNFIAALRTDYERICQQKDELIQNLELRLRSTQQTNQQTDELRNELSNSRQQIEELQSELADTKSQIEINDELNKNSIAGADNPSRDWILGRGEIEVRATVLGTGAWGNVKVGKFRGTEVAVKQIHLLILSPHNRRLFEREMSIASRCRHPCLVQFIGATNDDGTPLFVMELLKTDLRSVLTRSSLPNQDCVNIAYDVIRAIVYLHKSKPIPIIHRDISSSNILLYHGENGWRAKLSDYGAANFLRLSMTRHPGALLYSAPEASTMDQSPKLDVYSFGVLFCEMCTRELPVPENRRDQIRSVENTEYRALINNCIRREVTKRFDSENVLDVVENWYKRI